MQFRVIAGLCGTSSEAGSVGTAGSGVDRCGVAAAGGCGQVRTGADSRGWTGS